MLYNRHPISMKKVLKYSLLLLASAALFTACGEKDSDSSDTPSGGGSGNGGYEAPERKISALDVWLRETFLGTLHFKWEDDKLIALGTYDADSVWHERARFSYVGDLPSEFVEPPYDKVSYSHNSTGQISNVKYTFDGGDGEYLFSFTYSNGKVTRFIRDRIDDGESPDTTYLTWTGNNVTHFERHDIGNYGVEVREGTIQYSAKKNPIRLPIGVGIEFTSETHYRGVLEYLWTAAGCSDYCFWTENIPDPNWISYWTGDSVQYTFDGDWPVEMSGPDKKGTPVRIKFIYAD